MTSFSSSPHFRIVYLAELTMGSKVDESDARVGNTVTSSRVTTAEEDEEERELFGDDDD